MSAFGYGGSYNTSWRGNTATQNALTDPTFSVAPAMSQPNFAPVAGTPWDNPALRDVGNWETSRKGNLGNMTYNYGDLYSRDAWANPLSKFFQDASGVPDLSGLSKQNAMGSQLPTGAQATPIYGYAGPGGLNGSTSASDPMPARDLFRVPDPVKVGTQYDFGPGDQLSKGAKGTVPYRNKVPTNAKELFDQIGNFDLSQLQRLSGGTEGFSGNFSNIAQDYANAYANPNYGKKLWAQQDTNYGGNNLSQAETKDWLQQSYGKLLGKMDANYLL